MAQVNRIAEFSAKEQQKLGLPDGWKVFSAFPFGSMNQEDSRIGTPDNELYWVENFIKTGAGRMRTLWDHGTAIYTAATGRTIVSFFFFNIAAVQYAAVFLDNGTADQVQVNNQAITHISTTPGTFYTSGAPLPACCQSGSQYLLITNNITPNSYWIWDGTLLYTAGGIGPVIDITDGGAGYTSAPAVTPYGGSGSGIAVTASIANGSVVNLQVTNPGHDYLPGDVVQFQFSGGGTDTGAILQAVLTAGTLDSIELVAGGSGYTAGTYNLGFLGGGIPGATGSITFTVNPSNLDTITLNGQIWTFTTGAPGANKTVIQVGNLAATLTQLVSDLMASSNALIDVATYTATPTVLNIAYYTGGTAGNAYALAASVATPSGAFLTGGSGTPATGTYTVNASGNVASIVLSTDGANYTGTPSITFRNEAAGSGAAALALLSSGSVATITVVNGGTNFTGTPLITFVGGGGTGAAATAILTTGVITSVNVTNGGNGYTSAPTIELQTGLNNAAAAIAELMPYGVSGSSIEDFTSRVWLPYPNETGAQNNGGKFLVSVPGSLTDFATSDGGLIYTSSDRYLRAQYVNIRQSNGYLYPMGDSSIDVISNVQTSGSPPTTTFNYQNTDPQVGTPWRDSCQDYGRTVLFANKLGVYGLYGGAVTKVSSKLDSLFATAAYSTLPGAVTPSSAVANIYSLKVYLLLFTFKDPLTADVRTAMIAWNEKEWFIVSQSINLTYIGTQEVNSNLAAWGTDGTSLYPLINTPSVALQKRIVSKLYGGQTNYVTKEAKALIVTGDDHSENQSGFSFSANILTEAGGYPLPASAISLVNYQSPTPICKVWMGPSGDVGGSMLGFDFTTNALDEALYSISIGYTDVSSLYGSGDLQAG